MLQTWFLQQRKYMLTTKVKQLHPYNVVITENNQQQQLTTYNPRKKLQFLINSTHNKSNRELQQIQGTGKTLEIIFIFILFW